MTRTMHDSFVKEWMEGILTDFGEVEIEKQIAGEVRKIDLYFCPNFLANMDRTAIVVIHQLPRTIDTLFLRLLGRGKVQAEAIDELRALPLDHPYRGTTLHHISRLQINLKLRQNKTKEIREIIMNLAPAYDAWLEEVESKAIAKGEAKGKTEEQVTIARRMLQKNLPIETIAEVTGLSIETLEKLRSNSPSQAEPIVKPITNFRLSDP